MRAGHGWGIAHIYLKTGAIPQLCAEKLHKIFWRVLLFLEGGKINSGSYYFQERDGTLFLKMIAGLYSGSLEIFKDL